MKDFITIEKVLAGDVNAFATLIDDYKDLAFTLAYNIVMSREDAEEIVQDAFLKAYSGLKTFKRDSKFSTWFYRIVVNTSLNKRKLKKLNVVVIEDHLTEHITTDVTELFNYRSNEQKKFIRSAIKALNENERICIIMFYLNELSIEEIKELTGISSSNIKVLLYRGRNKIYEALQRLLKEEVKNLI